MKRVKSSLKGGVNVELGPKTLLCGPNGSGKTAVLQALKLAILGCVDDQEGKTGVAQTSVIARLFAPETKMSAVAEMSDGAVFSWAAEDKGRGKGFTRPKMTGPGYSVSFPFQDTKALFSGDEKKVRAWVEERVGNEMTEEELLDVLPAMYRAEGEVILSKFRLRSPVDLATTVKEEARNMKAAATRQETLVTKMTEDMPTPLSPGARDNMVARLEELQQKLRSANTVSAETKNRLRQQIVALAQQVEDCDNELNALPPKKPGDEALALEAQRGVQLTEAHLQQWGSAVCHVCLRPNADVKAANTRWRELAKKIQGQIQRDVLTEKRERLMAEAVQLSEEYKGMEVGDLQPLLDEQTKLAGTLAADTARIAMWRQVEGQKREVALQRATADLWSNIANVWGREGEDLLIRRKRDYETKVSAWLPSHERFTVDLSCGRVGLSNALCPSLVHTSLSGAETLRVLLAILAAEADGSTPTVFETDDRGWDPDTLSLVMEALKDAPAQVVLMSTVHPADPPDGWKIISIGG